jgi:hypothetical protein
MYSVKGKDGHEYISRNNVRSTKKGNLLYVESVICSMIKRDAYMYFFMLLEMVVQGIYYPPPLCVFNIVHMYMYCTYCI